MAQPITNYDTSSTMEDCELLCMLDCVVARMDFDDNFDVITFNGSRTICTAFYTDMRQRNKPETVSECYDFSGCSRRDFRSAVMELFRDESFRSIAGDCQVYHDWDWRSMLEQALEDKGLYGCIRDGFPDVPNAELLVWTTAITGYCQGDYAEILAWNDSIWDSVDPETKKPLPEDEIKAIMRDQFSHWFYDQPICCRLTVDGEESYFEQYLDDVYEWDADEIVRIAREKFVLPERVCDWLKNNLPEHPPVSD